MSATAHLRPSLPEAAYYGLPGAVARVLSASTGADPAGVLLVFLTMFGNAIGPQPHVYFGHDRQAARMFVLVVGDAATGGKGTILSVVEQLFAEADPDWYKHRVLTGLQSPEAMVERVADSPDGDCRLLVLEPEYARLVSRMASSGTAFSAHLRNAYDGRPLELARARGRDGARSKVRASHPHVSLVAQITPQELHALHATLRTAGGLETRFLTCLVARQGEADPFAPPSRAREVLVDRVREAIETSRERVLGAADPISRYLCIERGVQPSVRMAVASTLTESWQATRARLPTSGADIQPMLRRAETHVIRLALSYAIADQAPVISQVHLDAAMALWSYSALCTERIFGTPTGGLPPRVSPKHRGQLFEFLFEQGGWVARSAVMEGLFHHNLRKVDLDAIVDALRADDLIETRVVRQTGGAPRTEYRVVPRVA